MDLSPTHENLLGDTVSKDLSPLSPNVAGDSFLPARHFGQLQLRHSEKYCRVFRGPTSPLRVAPRFTVFFFFSVVYPVVWATVRFVVAIDGKEQ